MKVTTVWKDGHETTTGQDGPLYRYHYVDWSTFSKGRETQCNQKRVTRDPKEGYQAIAKSILQRSRTPNYYEKFMGPRGQNNVIEIIKGGGEHHVQEDNEDDIQVDER